MRKSSNWKLWIGFLLVFLGPVAYFSLYDRIPGAFWLGIAMVIVGVTLLIIGVRQAYVSPEAYRGKIAGPILGVLALLLIGAFGFGKYAMTNAYPASHNAPRVGDKAPQFTAKDTSGHSQSLADLLAAHAGAQSQRAVLLVFYRGYW